MEELITQYLVEEALGLVPALLILGRMVKGARIIPYRYIPLILGALGVGGSMALLGPSAESVVQGILAAGGAVYVHNLYKQMKEGS